MQAGRSGRAGWLALIVMIVMSSGGIDEKPHTLAPGVLGVPGVLGAMSLGTSCRRATSANKCKRVHTSIGERVLGVGDSGDYLLSTAEG
jgi:hypothetical protein